MSIRSGDVVLFVSTKKGLWILRSDAARRDWALQGPIHLGHIVNHTVLDPRDGRTLLAAARTGHLGPTIFRSTDLGKSWEESTRPPAFPKGEGPPDDTPPPQGRNAFNRPRHLRVVDYTFQLVPGHPSEPGVWYAGTSPEGLFRSEDAGATWEPIHGFNDCEWAGVPSDEPGTPDGDMLHSVLIDPRDPTHLYVAMSANAGGVFESNDRGATWRPLNGGQAADFAPPDPDRVAGFDPHCVQLHPEAPDVLWQQNHCGIYRLVRPGETWDRVGDHMPRDVGDIGFPISLHPRDADTAWVFPMDGTDVWPRISPGGRPAVYVTRDAGRNWTRCANGLPADQAWYTVLRQAMTTDRHEPLGVYFGATCGEIWGSVDEGATWSCLASHLPFTLAVEYAEVG